MHIFPYLMMFNVGKLFVSCDHSSFSFDAIAFLKVAGSVVR
jgi:hypothetical protein